VEYCHYHHVVHRDLKVGSLCAHQGYIIPAQISGPAR
jgi:serine/threonine protein kinase